MPLSKDPVPYTKFPNLAEQLETLLANTESVSNLASQLTSLGQGIYVMGCELQRIANYQRKEKLAREKGA